MNDAAAQDAAPAEVHLAAGQFHFGGGRVRLHTLLGTCVAIALWHPARRLGGMCHYLLPTRGSNAAVERASRGLYADEVMDLFADALRATGTVPREYVVKVAGGGNMFPEQAAGTDCRAGTCIGARRPDCQSIGCRNALAARTLLDREGYAVTSESVGGHGSRQVIFELWSGDVWIRRGAAMSGGSEVAA